MKSGCGGCAAKPGIDISGACIDPESVRAAKDNGGGYGMSLRMDLL